VLPSASTLSNICKREYTLTVNAIKKQLPSTNEVSLALDGWTSTNKLAIRLFIADYMDRNWALREVQLAFDGVDSRIFSYFESSLRTTGQGSAYGSTSSRTFERRYWLFRTQWRPCPRNYDWQRFPNYLTTRKLQSPLEASGIEWPAIKNHIPCIAHIIRWSLGAFMSSLGVKGRAKSWEAHEHNQ